MKKIISLCLLMAYGCLSVMATQDAKEYKTYVKDNHRVYYCTNQGISIVVDPSPRGLFEPHITIINDSGHDFVFEPKEIRAYAYAAPGNTYKETRYLRKAKTFVSTNPPISSSILHSHFSRINIWWNGK